MKSGQLAAGRSLTSRPDITPQSKQQSVKAQVRALVQTWFNSEQIRADPSGPELL
jgi:hypothetical protein